MTDVRNLLANAEKRRGEQEKQKIDKDIEERQAFVGAERLKVKSARIEISNKEKERAEALTSKKKIGELSGFITPDEAAEATTVLDAVVCDTDAVIAKVTQEILLIEGRIGNQTASLERLRDRLFALNDPTYRPKFPANLITSSIRENCREEIMTTHDYCSNILPRIVSTCKTNEERRLHCTVYAGKMRVLQRHLAPLNDVEEKTMRLSFGLIGSQTKETMCGIVDALDKAFETDWDKYVADAGRRLQSVQLRYQVAAAPKKEEPEPEDQEDELAKVAIESGLVQLMDKKRVAIFGGVSTKQPDLQDWLVNVFNLGKLVWYESDGKEIDGLVQSIKNNGIDMLVYFTQWTSHPAYFRLVNEARNKSIPIVLCKSSNKVEVCKQLAVHFAVKLSLA